MQILVAYTLDTETGQMRAADALDGKGADAVVQPLDGAGRRWAVDTVINDDAVRFYYSEHDIRLGLARTAEEALRKAQAAEPPSQDHE